MGAKFQYFNLNYTTLALIVETVSGQRYGAFVRERIFEPLGMRDSYGGYEEAAGLAQGHSKLFGFPVSRDVPPYRYLLGAGHVVSTAPDLARLAIAMANRGAHGDGRILSPRSVEIMHSVSPTEDSGYGMGWTVGKPRGEMVGGHDGGDPAFMGQLWLLPDHDRGYTLLMNQEHLIDTMTVLPQLKDGILDLLMGRPAPEGGVSVRLLGAMTLAIFLVTVALAIRSLIRLRGWSRRARTATTRQLARAILPRFASPVLIVVAVCELTPLLLGQGFNVGWAGRYYLPDVLLLLVVATVPDLLQGLYMLGAAVAQRRSRALSRGGLVTPCPRGRRVGGGRS